LRALILSVFLLWQLAPSPAGGKGPQPFQYERDIELPSHAEGQACVVLDGAVFAHAATSSALDLRLYAQRPGVADLETPFALLEGAPAAVDSEDAGLRNVSVRNGLLVFDLITPARPYSEVDLQLNAINFLGSAQVFGADAQHNHPVPLGAHPIFDLTEKGLPRSTVLRLPASSFPDLHIELRLTDLAGHPLPQLAPNVIAGARIPTNGAPSVYTTVAETSKIEQQGQWSLATFTVPAHLPVERVRFVTDPKFTRDFLRNITIAATPAASGYDAVGAAESVSGEIFRVTHTPMPHDLPPIDLQHLSVDVALGSNLQSPAKVMASIHNESETPLPITAVELQMRQRDLCFEALPGASYVLRYGNPALSAPSYSYIRKFRLEASPIAAELGPEHMNARYAPQVAYSSGRRRADPKILWILVLSVVGGVVAVQYTRYKHRDTQ
jgi:hypothetical protein